MEREWVSNINSFEFKLILDLLLTHQVPLHELNSIFRPCSQGPGIGLPRALCLGFPRQWEVGLSPSPSAPHPTLSKINKFFKIKTQL